MTTIGRSKKRRYRRNRNILIYAVHDLMQDILQELLCIKEPCHMIADHLKNDSKVWSHLKGHEKDIILKATAEGYSDFDVSLIYKVLRNLNIIPKPTKGWGHATDPESSETTVGDDIERVRRYRNLIAHSCAAKLEVTDDELTQWLSAFRDVAKRMEIYLGKCKGDFTNKFEKLETDELNDDILDSFVKRIQCLTDQVDQLRQYINNVHINGKYCLFHIIKIH